MFEQMQRANCSSSIIRRKNLESFSQNWKLLHSTRTCLWCLLRKPEHFLRCGHTLCETCVHIFGTPSKEAEYRFYIKTCILCDTRSHVEVKSIPPTASVRAISIDGGGMKGIVPLEFLDALQRRMNLPYRLQEEIDIAFGTSSGEHISVSRWLYNQTEIIRGCQHPSRLRDRPEHLTMYSHIFKTGSAALPIETSLRSIYPTSVV